MRRKLGHLRSLTIAKFTDDEDIRFLIHYIHTDDLIAGAQPDTADAAGGASHRSGILLIEANSLALSGRNNYFVIAAGHTYPLQLITLIEPDCDNAVSPDILVLLEGRFLNYAPNCTHK